MKSKNKIDPRDARAVVLKLEGKTNAEIAKLLGGKHKDDNSAGASVSRRLRRVKEAGYLDDILNKYGATDKAVITAAVAGLTAHDTKIGFHQGKAVTKVRLIDHGARQRSAELIGRWKGWDKVTLQNPDGSAVGNVIFYFPDNGRSASG